MIYNKNMILRSMIKDTTKLNYDHMLIIIIGDVGGIRGSKSDTAVYVMIMFIMYILHNGVLLIIYDKNMVHMAQLYVCMYVCYVNPSQSQS